MSQAELRAPAMTHDAVTNDARRRDAMTNKKATCVTQVALSRPNNHPSLGLMYRDITECPHIRQDIPAILST